jgi:hypothetical protein
MRLSLPSVALVCCDTRDARASLDSLSRSLALVDFGDCVYATSQQALDQLPDGFSINPLIRVILIEPIKSISAYSGYVLTQLQSLSDRPFFLVSQWDSWVLSETNWSDEFFQYDYIGAVWPHHSTNRVGNGGFSLRSRKLMTAAAILVETNSSGDLDVEDDFICRQARADLESKFSCRFAPEGLANRFSAERLGWDMPTFGFHGLLNFGRVFGVGELIEVLEKLSDHYFGDRHSADLIRHLLESDRMAEAKYVIHRRVGLSGWTTKNLKLKLFWFLRGLMAPRIFSRCGDKTTHLP